MSFMVVFAGIDVPGGRRDGKKPTSGEITASDNRFPVEYGPQIRSF